MIFAAACASGGAGGAGSSAVSAGPSETAPTRDYLVYVASEATDRVALVRFGPAGAQVESQTTVSANPTEPDGPHGLAVSPDGRYWYVSTAHGTPFGYLWKFATQSNQPLGRVMLGSFPATLQLTPDGALAFVANFNLHGEMVPSSVSVVATDEMVEVARIETCTMPHGSRLNPQGTRHYSACMMDDMIVEIDAHTLRVARRFTLGDMTHSAHGGDASRGHRDPTCSPTWAQPSASGASVFVACNKSSEIVEIDVASWTVERRLPAGDGVYNLAVTRDGTKLIGTNKRGQSVSVFDLASWRELARIPTKRRVVHGAVVSPDDRYAFISVEGVGSEPGTLEVVDLAALRIVASVDVGQMAGGIDFWRMEPAR